MSQDIINTELYKSLENTKQAVDAIDYFAQNTPEDDSDFAMRNVLAIRLKSDFEKLHSSVYKALNDQVRCD